MFLITIHEWLNTLSANYGEQPAFLTMNGTEKQTHTFHDFKADVEKLACYLVSSGLHGEHIALIGENSYQWVVTYMAVSISGNVIVPVDKLFPENSVYDVLRMSECSLVIGSKPQFDRLPQLTQQKYPLERVLELPAPAEASPLPEVDCYALNTILFTSGTTGMSKGVMLSQNNLMSNVATVAGMSMLPGLTPVIVCALPFHHTFQFTLMLVGLARGFAIAIGSDISKIVEYIHCYQPGIISVVPAVADRLAMGIKSGMPREQLLGANLKMIIVGGAAANPLTTKFFRSIDVMCYEGYGLTETSPIISCRLNGEPLPGCAGQVISNLEVRVENDEILVKGPSIMLGYYHNDEETRNAFSGEWFRTGDIGEFRDGLLYIKGRLKNVIILANGKNVYPEEYEHVIGDFPGVREVAVYEDEKRITAEIFTESPGDEALSKAISARINEYNESLPTYMRIVNIRFRRKEFIKTTTNKIKRSELKKKFAEDVVPPQTDMEKKVCAVFAKVLHTNIVGATDNFFSIGGDSLSAVEVCCELGIQTQKLYEKPIVRDLAAQLESTVDDSSDRVLGEKLNGIIQSSKPKSAAKPPKNIFLTGATGYLGAHILKELVARGCEVWCLVRSEKKLGQVIDAYFGDSLDTKAVHAVEGNIEQSELGMDVDSYDTLCEKIDAVVHVAANVHHVGNFEDLRRTNDFGTRNVLRFAQMAMVPFHHTSTSSVSGSGITRQDRPDSTFDETVLDIGQHYRDNVYIHTKYLAENAALHARAAGLPVNIYRIGNLTPRVSDGKFQINSADNGFLGRLRAIAKLGTITDSLDRYKMDLTAVDECAKAFVALIFRGKLNEIYHLYNPNLITIRESLDMLGLPYQVVSEDAWKQQLYQNREDRDCLILSFYISSAANAADINTTCDFTVSCLQESGFAWSKPDLGYLAMLGKLAMPQ